MTTLYSKKNSPTERPSENAVLSVNDNSSQSKSLQRKADMANAAAQRAEAPRPNNTGMPDNLKSGIESLSGFSMDDVRVHYNSSKPATVQALAYTQGTDIHVAPGQEKHLPHEAWHVAQQMAGRVSPTTNINGMPVNDNAALEHEADVMGEKAVQCKMDIGKIEKQCNVFQNTILQRKTDHLFNDIPKTISSLTIKQNDENLCLIKSVPQKDAPNKYHTLNNDLYNHYKELNEIRNVLKKDDVHTEGEIDQNNEAFSKASDTLKEDFQNHNIGLIYYSVENLWKHSIDNDVKNELKKDEKGKEKGTVENKIREWNNHSAPVASTLCAILVQKTHQYIDKGTIK